VLQPAACPSIISALVAMALIDLSVHWVVVIERARSEIKRKNPELFLFFGGFRAWACSTGRGKASKRLPATQGRGLLLVESGNFGTEAAMSPRRVEAHIASRWPC
jgi:hypothetical protein